MNKQTLNYHTRLHDWYRQHCIQQEKQPKQQLQTHQQQAGAGTGKVHSKSNDVSKHGCLTTDKMFTIDQWCADVNRTLFCIKKKEASPLYRKCRLSASIKSATATTKAADPRRIKSAEVFTRTSYWSKQHRPVLRGGELLPHQRESHDKTNKPTSSHMSVAAVSEKSNNKVEFCVTNNHTENKSVDDEKIFPRVNHDSLNIRNSSVVHRQPTDKIVDKSVVLSPCFIPGSLKSNTDKLHPGLKTGHKAKTVTVNYVINSLVRESNENQSTQPGHNEFERQNNLKNGEHCKNHRIFSASQRSVKTDVHSSALGADLDGKEVLNAVVKFCEQDVMPSFCNTCSGIYSGNTPPPPTPATCTNCVHGIKLGTDPQEGTNRLSQAEIQKELAQKLVHNEKVYSEKITNANIELKMSENRLTEDSLHYTAEREMARNNDCKPRFSLPATFDDLQDERNISFQTGDGSTMSDNGNDSGNNVSMESPQGGNTSDVSMGKENRHSYSQEDNIVIDTGTPRKESDEESQGAEWRERNFHQPHYFNTGSDNPHLNLPPERRGGRRMSISFTYKPEVSNISKSNNLLRVLSIDDCKMGMRYNPHKVLEDHEVTENPVAEMIKQAMGTFGPDEDDLEGDSHVAMRVSQNSSVTSLQASNANDATNANRMHYKILFGPEDLNQFKNIRPQSAYLDRAFETMIYDRTIMQKLDRPGSSEKAKNARTIAPIIEGPKYRIINTALKREMGNMLQAQRQKLIQKYEKQKLGIYNKKLRPSSRLSESTEKSLSLDSLPSIKKGILKD